MPYLHDHKLFISHAWKYSDRYTRAVKFLNDAQNFKWSNYSVPEDKAFVGMSSEELGEQMKRQIRPVQCVVIVSGMYVNHSDWIQYEMDFAKKIGKPILGIKRWGEQRTPQSVVNCADEMVAWNSASIVSAIRRLVP
ncbi:TIR-like domain protein [Roseovarius mucosus DSM 17069]|uniref:TIR-like domain protein n=1 Tax=Roseovarius mucosus DSM 17069 TaxID=1288298 RepID=A0A0A0HGR5_9RHOB|nr:TIR domain-containing protein [Roseovarius mucosus]KGM85844.1 TIR-like domain protein [Roseovarius mucosus DSM 17069]